MGIPYNYNIVYNLLTSKALRNMIFPMSYQDMVAILPKQAIDFTWTCILIKHYMLWLFAYQRRLMDIIKCGLLIIERVELY